MDVLGCIILYKNWIIVECNSRDLIRLVRGHGISI